MHRFGCLSREEEPLVLRTHSVYSIAKVTSVAEEFEDSTSVITPFAETLVFEKLDWSPLEVETDTLPFTVEPPLFKAAVIVPLPLLM